MENELMPYEAPLTAVQVKAQVQAIQQIMQAVMKDGHHYGKIPGCGDKPTLLKPGAEKIMMTFRLAVDPQVQEIPTDDGFTFRIFSRITDQRTGAYLGTGVGECSTKEDKYNWRGIVSDDEWNATAEDRRRIKYTKDKQIKQVRTNPADVANTVLKMGKKRSLIDGVLTVTAASDIFTQDLDEVPDELKDTVKEGREPIKQPQAKATEQAPAAPDGVSDITGTIETVSVKTGKGAKGPWTKYGIKIGEQWYGTFDTKIGQLAESLKGQTAKVWFTNDGKYNTCTEIAPIEGAKTAIADPPDCPHDPAACSDSSYDQDGKANCTIFGHERLCPYQK